MTGTRARLNMAALSSVLTQTGSWVGESLQEINQTLYFAVLHILLCSALILLPGYNCRHNHLIHRIENFHLSSYQPGVFSVRRECNWGLWLPNSSKLLLVTLDSMIGCYDPVYEL